MRFAITEKAINSAPLHAELDNPLCGALVSFEGRVRNHHQGLSVRALHYECYRLLAESEGERILGEALSRFDISEARCIHRIGDLVIGDCAIWVVVSAAHRDAAFAACRWIVDEVKQHVPIWKHEHYANGESFWRTQG